MNSNSNNHIVQLINILENLTIFPHHEICDQLDERSLVLVSFLSEKWEQVVKKQCERREKSTWEITLSKNVLMIYLKFEDAKKNFQIGFKEDQNSSEDFHFEHDRRWNCYTFFYKTSYQLEEASFKALELLSNLFPPTSYQRITVPLGPRCPDFPFQFLSKLPRGNPGYVDLQADKEVDCGDLVKFLGNVNLNYTTVYTKSRLCVNLRMKNVVPCDEIVVYGTRLSMVDARFLTRESIQRLDTRFAEIGENNLTSQDFNAFLRAWTRGSKQIQLDEISFAIQEDQKINMKEVLKGLRVHDGQPKVRDRWYLTYQLILNGYLYPKAIDCGQAHTILNCNGHAGAILLEPNRLSFFNFAKPINWSSYNSFLNSQSEECRHWIQNRQIEQKRLETTIAARGVNARAEDLKKLVRILDDIETEEQNLKETLAVKEKLNTVWKNNEVVYCSFAQYDKQMRLINF